MIGRKSLLLVAAMAVLGACALAFGSTGADGKPKTPKRVLIVLFDQMRPEYADRFGMTNFKKLRGEGTDFDKAYLGYMGSETVISHNVIVSGMQPKHMGWVDEAYRDTDNLLGFGANTMHITGDLSLANFTTLVTNGGYPKLSDYLHTTFPGTKFITVGEKSYAVESAAATAGAAAAGDIAVRMSSRRPAGECVAGLRFRRPQGLNVPSYLLDFCGRYYVNSTGTAPYDYGTLAAFPSFMYPEEADRFFPGTDTAHLGGDRWVADAAMAMMENENWSGMFVTLGGIDKAGHMWGADADTEGHDCSVGTGQVHVDCAAKIADEQLGLLLQKLDDLGQLDETLVVLTADHGATHGAPFLGKMTSGAGDSNWYYDATGAVFDGGAQYAPFGSGANPYNNPSPNIAAFAAAIGGNLQFSYQSTSIQAWLLDTSEEKLEAGRGRDARRPRRDRELPAPWRPLPPRRVRMR